MAATKKKAKSTKGDPFKTRKTRQTEKKVAADTVTPNAEIAQAIDEFREAQEQAKHFEGEATIHKDKILEYCKGEYAKRLLSGKPKSFKVLGDESMVTYIVMDSSAGLTEEDAAYISEKWGEEAAEDLLTRDFRSIRFDEKVMEAHYDKIVEALQTLDDDILEHLFKPMLMKTKSDISHLVKKYAKSSDEIEELLNDLKVKHYIK
jgi:hypothetical protein